MVCSDPQICNISWNKTFAVPPALPLLLRMAAIFGSHLDDSQKPLALIRGSSVRWLHHGVLILNSEPVQGRVYSWMWGWKVKASRGGGHWGRGLEAPTSLPPLLISLLSVCCHSPLLQGSFATLPCLGADQWWTDIFTDCEVWGLWKQTSHHCCWAQVLGLSEEKVRQGLLLFWVLSGSR